VITRDIGDRRALRATPPPWASTMIPKE